MGRQHQERQLAKARARGYLTVRGEHDREAVEAWTADCQEQNAPLLVVHTIGSNLGMIVAQGIAAEPANEILQQLVAAANEVDQKAATFPVDREQDGTITLGPYTIGRARRMATALAVVSKSAI